MVIMLEEIFRQLGYRTSARRRLKGWKRCEVLLLRDAHGRIQGKYEEGMHDVMPKSGQDLTLSIDIELQAYGEYLMQNKIGSIVMIDPKQVRY